MDALAEAATVLAACDEWEREGRLPSPSSNANGTGLCIENAVTAARGEVRGGTSEGSGMKG